MPSGSSSASSSVATLVVAVVVPAATVTIRVSGRVAVANAPSWLRRTDTARPPVGAAWDRVTVNLAVAPSSIGEVPAAIVALIVSSSRTTTSAEPGVPTA